MEYFMKKVFSKIIPFLLVLLILASLYWYCFIFDRNFTRDMLLGQARYQSTDGNPRIASWFYDQAYELSDQDDDVAIELANQFRNAGNFSKAEYTLTNAIADRPTVELYKALCKTYVQQDKLLDAVTMLDSIYDPALKAQMDALRPEAPTTSVEPGFYSEYIPVSLSAEGGSIYYTLDGEYPSLGDYAYADPFTLPAGETVVQALTVSTNGLVSPLTTFTFTVGGVIEEVVFTDNAIDVTIRQMLNIGENKTIYSNMLWDILEFTAPEGSMNLQELRHLPYLQKLTIQDQTLDTLAFLASLSNLKELNLIDCRFAANELDIIAGLPALERLTLANCSLSTISGLESAQNLTYLDLSNNTIRNLDPLSTLVNLQTLNLGHNAVVTLNALSGLVNLESLNICYNVISSITPIATCHNLTDLTANNNQLVNLDGIENLTSLKVLNVSKNALTNVSVLGSCTALTELNIGNNSSTDISALSTLTELELFTFSYNQVENLPAWPDGSKLRSIDGTRNQVRSLENLKNMHNLTHVLMDYNQITSVNPIASCYNLVQVNVYGNEIDNVDALKEHDIIVNWDPTAAD